MSTAIAVFEHARGETITFGIRAIDPEFDGTESIQCDIKAAINGASVPSASTAVVMSPAFNFVAADGGAVAHWLFTVTADQSDAMAAGTYVTDAKITLASGSVVYPKPIALRLLEVVTE